MNEILPIVAGFLMGTVLWRQRPGMRWVFGSVFAVGMGALAAWISGELMVSWGSLCVDVLIAGFSEFAGFVAASFHSSLQPGA